MKRRIRIVPKDEMLDEFDRLGEADLEDEEFAFLDSDHPLPKDIPFDDPPKRKFFDEEIEW